jgi:hypothetical protein
VTKPLLKIARTLQLMYYALLPKRELQEATDQSESELRLCEPKELRGGVDRFLDEKGELRVLFAGCLGLAAPFVLFRLKRQGFSRCVVRVTEAGLYVEARR